MTRPLDQSHPKRPHKEAPLRCLYYQQPSSNSSSPLVKMVSPHQRRNPRRNLGRHTGMDHSNPQTMGS